MGKEGHFCTGVSCHVWLASFFPGNVGVWFHCVFYGNCSRKFQVLFSKSNHPNLTA